MALTPTSEDEAQQLTLAYFSNEFPHEDLSDLVRKIHNHAKDKRHPILATFIRLATAAVIEEIRVLPAELKKLLPPIQSILHLADYPDLRKGALSGSIDGVLLCVFQLATFIGYHEDSGEDFHFSEPKTILAGLGIGLLTSSAIALSQTLADIPTAGADVIRLAFRLGVVVNEVSQNLFTQDVSEPDHQESWAYVLPDVDPNEVQGELDSLQIQEGIPPASRIFISAVSKTSVTISGPPPNLKSLLRKSDFFRDRQFFALPVFSGLCHAAHIYDQSHVLAITQFALASELNKPTSSVFSTNTGSPFVAATALQLFEGIVFEILTKQIRWDNVITGVLSRIEDTEAVGFQSLIFHTSLPVHDLLDIATSKIPSLAISTTDLIPWISKPKLGSLRSSASPANAKIAIVGMSCRMPGGATDTEKFWEILEQGLDVHRRIPADRFDVDSHWDPTGKRMNTSHTQYGCFIDQPGLFDAPFFNMSPREAEQTDPMQRLALVTAYEALERAGYVANRTPATNLHRIGTFYGQASDDYREVNTAQEISTYFIPGGCRAFGPGRINYFFKFSGPSFSIDTACSSSLATIQAACSSLWNGETDTVVAGGMNILTNSDAFAGLCNGHFLTKTPNACKTWDSEADGYCRADGIGSIVMKRLEDAEADNDNIIGVILGAGTNHSADAISITHPHAGAQGFLSRQVLASAGVDPLDVSFVEMHGTGTQAGDTVEIESVTDVYAPLVKRRSAKSPLHIGAVKANVGHGEAVAGVTALLKVLLMFKKELIPPHAGIKHGINPAFPKDLDKRNLRIAFEKQPWPRVAGKKRIAAVNNFSAAGGNTTILIEEGPIREVTETDPRSHHLVVVSAKSKISLKGNLERLVAYLEQNPETSLADLSYTTTARRYHHNQRIVVAGSDLEYVKKHLKAAAENTDTIKPIPSTGAPPVTFTFTGQGASYKSMNLELYHESPFFKAQIAHLDSLARGQGFPSFVPAIDGSYPKTHQHSPVITQLALVSIQIALARYWASLGVKPDAVIGHSLGEYAALHVAGVLSVSDAIFLAGKRASLLERKCQIGSHGMLAVRASLADIEAAADKSLYEIACVNGPKEIVLSGETAKIKEVAEKLDAEGIKTTLLDVAFAFHSAQTDPILEEFEAIAEAGVLFQPPQIPVISPLLKKVIFDDKSLNAEYVRRATRETVDFAAALEAAKRISTIEDSTVWIEIGPHPVTLSFVKSTLAGTPLTVASLRRDESNWATISQGLGVLHKAGIDIAWTEYHRHYEYALSLLDLPTYSWNDKNHWIQYNGDWALTKGNTFYDAEKGTGKQASVKSISDLRTSTVQTIIEEHFDKKAGKVVMQSDLMQPDFLAAAHGHSMNGCGVVTSSIHADIAYTLGEYLYRKLRPKSKKVNINVAQLEVVKGLVAQKDTKSSQLIEVSVATEDIDSGFADIQWRNKGDEEPFATSRLFFECEQEWLDSWIPMTHLIQGRIEALEQLATQGRANRLSRKMAYQLFANNLVDYAEKYRGMQAVVLHELEAFADVQLTMEKSGTWTVPPYFIDSVAHLAGFIMNVSDAIDTKANFCVTPGWQSMRFARPLVAGAKYRSYVKMIPTKEDPAIYNGDVYILQDDIIIGMVGSIRFRRYPRLLLDRFFSPPDTAAGHSHHNAAASKASPSAKTISPTAAAQKPAPVKAVVDPAPAVPAPPAVPKAEETAKEVVAAAPVVNLDSTAAKAIALVASEAGLDIEELEDEASFASLGVDSLMSLVIAEKFREELGVTVGGSLFLEYPTIGDLRKWLLEYYD